ncbi:MAG TPA: isocitrate lyase/PEP mutase family protein [bacterium]|jgi:2-methylisocitrate lyase-like PEP mutase family enzyme|nr:isocitrate lyase/PEP mutase family protein [bacterium]
MRGPSALRKALRARIAAGPIVVVPGVFDGLSARLAEETGFEAVYASGGAIARSSGLPDLGLLDLSEMVARIRQITQAVSLPVIADADTGYGNALAVLRTVRAYEDAGAAALHLEDQVAPKRCGHYEGHELITRDEMVGKVRAALEARTDPDFIIIARTDARATNGLEEALRRGQTYAQAGADMVFVEAPRSLEEVQAIARAIPRPLMYNMTYSGKSPLLSPLELDALGYRLVIFPADAQLAAIWGMRRALAALRRDGRTPEEERATFADRDALVHLDAFLTLADRYGDPGRGEER